MKSIKYIICLILLNVSISVIAQHTKVSRVIDGDTFETITGEKVRLVGINAPEISDIFGIESKEHLSKLIVNNEIELIPDKISNNTDRYGRSLRYVLVNGSDINKQMIIEGYAIAYLKYKFEKSEEYRMDQLNSMKSNKGMWNSGTGIEKSNLLTQPEQNKIGFPVIDKKIIFISVLLVSLVLIGLYFYFKKS